MKTITLKTLRGIEVKYEVTENSVEMNTLANRIENGSLVDVAHDRAVDYTVFHQVLGDVRSHLVDKVVALKFTLPDGTLLAPKTVQAFRTKKSGEKVPYLKPDESDSTFIDRAVAAGAVDEPTLKTWAQEFCSSKDAAWAEYLKATTRHAGPSAPSKTAVAKVEEWFAAPNPDERMDKFEQVSGLKLDDRTDRVALARKVDEYRKAAVAAAAAQLKAQEDAAKAAI